MEERNILLAIKQRKANSIGNFLFRNGLLRHFIEGNRMKDRRDGKTWKKSEHLLNDRKETRRYWKLKEKILDRTAWETHYGKMLWIFRKAN
jgi:hypothetical protein